MAQCIYNVSHRDSLLFQIADEITEPRLEQDNFKSQKFRMIDTLFAKIAGGIQSQLSRFQNLKRRVSYSLTTPLLISIDFAFDFAINVNALLNSIPTDASTFYLSQKQVSDPSQLTLKSLGVQSSVASKATIVLGSLLGDLGVTLEGTFLSSEIHLLFAQQGSSYDQNGIFYFRPWSVLLTLFANYNDCQFTWCCSVSCSKQQSNLLDYQLGQQSGSI